MKGKELGMSARDRSTPRTALLLALLAAGAPAADTAWGAPPGSGRPEGAAGETEERVQRRVVVRGVGEGPDDLEWKILELDGEGSGAYGLLAAERGFLGVALVEVTPELRAHFGAPQAAGVLVSRVEPDSPAARAGLQVGDLLTAIDGESVRTPSEVARRIGDRQEGDVAALEVWRGGKLTRVRATLEKRRRPQVEIGRLLRQRGEPGRPLEMWEIEALPPGAIAIDVEMLDGAVREMMERIRTPEWEERLLEMRQRREGLQGRIAELEKRLAELEKRLAELPK